MTQILIFADSMSGTGHQRRAEALARALVQHGYGVTYLSHGLFDRALAIQAKFTFVELPGYAAALGDPQALVGVKLERTRRIMALRRTAGPFAALICEHYPLGKLYLDDEVALLRRFFARPATRIICVYRDIMDDGDLAEMDRSLERLNQDFHALLVFSDAAYMPLPDLLIEKVRIPVTYLGYLDPEEPRTILVFGGGGKFNDEFYAHTLVVVNEFCARADLAGLFYTGSLVGETTFAELAAHAAPAVQIRRATDDLHADLQSTIVTISTLGYNTLLDLLHFNNANIVVPLARNDEQMTRARLLQRLKPQVAVIELDADYTTNLSAALENLLSSTLNRGGLRHFIQAIDHLCPPPLTITH